MLESILNRIRDFFLASGDYNGILLSSLYQEIGVSWADMQSYLSELVRQNKISLSFASHTINPHIKRLPDLLVDEQLERLIKEDPNTICAYPSPGVIRDAIDISIYDTQPFTRRLALAEAHLTSVFFDLDVLDRYYRDPRFHFDFHDFAGSIRIASDHYDSPETPERDKILLQSFGIGYDDKRNRVVVAYLRYLADLSPEHQQIWNAYVVSDSCAMNSDYELTTIYGNWPTNHSVYQAFLSEQAEINKLSQLIGKPNLFREAFEEKRPEGFHPMLRPTRRNFDEFIHLFDKLLSENINRDFFKGDVPLEHQVERDDGTIEVQRSGTLQLLEQWLSRLYRTADGEDVSREVIAPFKEIRKLRQKPAHTLGDNEYDRAYTQRQDDILGEACLALTKLWIILWSHPKARNLYAPPEWLDSGKIVFY